MVIASKSTYLLSRWVKTEWSLFENEIRAKRKDGNLIVLISKQIPLHTLPIALRNKEIFYLEDNPYSKILAFTGLTETPIIPRDSKKWKKMIPVLLFLLVALVVSYVSYTKYQEVKPPVEEEKIVPEQEFQELKTAFLANEVSETLVFEKIKKLSQIEPIWGYKGAELFQEKAVQKPLQQEELLNFSQLLLDHSDSLRHAN